MSAPNFDRIARAYRWLEYLALGRLLERTREHYLPRLKDCRCALVLGDGDGRFTAQVLASNPELQVDAIDLSQTMLELLLSRSVAEGYASRLHTHHADARTFTPTIAPDLIVTHFFLDCLTQPEVDALIRRLRAPGVLWLVSEFRIPPGAMQWPARIYILILYFAFRMLTGLRVHRLPDYERALRANGFAPVALHRRLRGILTSELWICSSERQ